MPRRPWSVAFIVALPVTALVLGGSRFPPARAAASAPVVGGDAGDSTMWTELQNVNLRVGTRGALSVRSLRGRVIQTTPGVLASLDDPESFGIEVTRGIVALDGEALGTLLNERVFAYRGAPVRDLRVRVENGQVIQEGIMHKGVDLRFRMTGTLTLTPDGRIRLHPTRLTLMGVNGLALLHALGLKLEKVLDVRGTEGIIVMDGDDMLLDPLRMIPPPRVTGRIASVTVEGDEIVQTFDVTPGDTVFGPLVRVDTAVSNYIYYRGGALRFGKLTMWPTDLLIMDADDTDPFDLYLERYDEQLVAGYTRTMADDALRTWMPDYADLKQGSIAFR